MSIVGTWDAAMKTPIGSMKAVFVFRDEDGVLVGEADNGGDVSEMRDIVLEGDGRVTWSMTVNKPMRLNLAFDVRVTGDELHGISRAGRLPKSAVIGSRRAA